MKAALLRVGSGGISCTLLSWGFTAMRAHLAGTWWSRCSCCADVCPQRTVCVDPVPVLFVLPGPALRYSGETRDAGEGTMLEGRQVVFQRLEERLRGVGHQRGMYFSSVSTSPLSASWSSPAIYTIPRLSSSSPSTSPETFPNFNVWVWVPGPLSVLACPFLLFLRGTQSMYFFRLLIPSFTVPPAVHLYPPTLSYPAGLGCHTVHLLSKPFVLRYQTQGERRSSVCSMEKCVDFSVLTVITGDPNLEPDELGAPRKRFLRAVHILDLFLMRNCVTDAACVVAPYNITYLQGLVRNSPIVYSGAQYLIRDTGERIDLQYNKRADAFLQDR